MQKKVCVVYGEGAVTDWMYQEWFAKFCAGDFLLDDAPRSGGPVEANQSNWDINWEQSMIYHVGDSWYIQNIQINKVIGENGKCVFYIIEKKTK